MKLTVKEHEKHENGILYKFELDREGVVENAFLFVQSPKTEKEFVELSHGRFKRFGIIDISLEDYKEQVEVEIV